MKYLCSSATQAPPTPLSFGLFRDPWLNRLTVSWDTFIWYIFEDSLNVSFTLISHNPVRSIPL